MDAYEKGVVLGEGTFGSVFKATHKETGKVVAIKKIRLAGSSREGINVTAIREIKLLKELKCPYIIDLIDVFPHKRNLAMVLEYAESDLEAMIKDKSIVLSISDVKAYMRMLLEALNFCHKRWVLHRDVKPNNMLISQEGLMKLGDFGLARVYGSPGAKYTNQVFARWYRAPELLFGSVLYTSAVDIWAAGCVFAELLLRRPWLPGISDIDQLGKIFQALGTPTSDQWPGVTHLPCYVEFQKTPAPSMKSMFPKANDDALDLLSKMCSLNPSKRPSAEAALKHPFFTNAPAPTLPAELPKPVPRELNPLQLAPGAKPGGLEKKPKPDKNSVYKDEEGEEPAAKKGRFVEGNHPTDNSLGTLRGNLTPPVKS